MTRDLLTSPASTVTSKSAFDTVGRVLIDVKNCVIRSHRDERMQKELAGCRDEKPK